MTFEEYKDNYQKRWQKRMIKYYAIVIFVHLIATALLNISFYVSNLFTFDEFFQHIMFRTLLPLGVQLLVVGPSIAFIFNPNFSTKNKCRVTVFAFFWIMSVMAFFQSKYSLFMVFPTIPMFLAAILTEKRMLRVIFIADLFTIPPLIFTSVKVFIKEFSGAQIVTLVSLYATTILIYYISKEILRAQTSHIEFMRHNYNRQVALTEELQIEPLTKLYNRLALSNSVEKLISMINMPGFNLLTSPATMIFLDLDNFKLINDKCGHAIGDSVLIALGESIIKVINTNRTAFRYGGDEFILLLRDSNLAESICIVEKIMHEFKNSTSKLITEDLQCTMSIGISIYRKGWDFKDWFKSADNAAYRAKQNGKNRYEIAE